MKRILIVDDEERMAKLIKLYIEPDGYCCTTLNSGTEAIQYVKDHNVDLILMDVMMPMINGWETVKEIRNFSNVPVIMLTARDQYSDITQSIKYGANGHIAKPIDERKLLFHIGKLIEDSDVINSTQLVMME